MAKNIKLAQLADTIMDNDDYTKPICLVEHGGTNLATTFLRYRDVNYLHAMNRDQMEPERIRLALLGGLRFGKPMVIDMEDVDLFDAVKTFINGVRPTLYDEIVSNEIAKEDCFKTLVKESDDPQYQVEGATVYEYMRYVPNFRVIIALRGKDPPADIAAKFQVVNVRK